VNSGKNGGVGRDWGDLNVQPLNASLAVSKARDECEARGDIWGRYEARRASGVKMRTSEQRDGRVWDR